MKEKTITETLAMSGYGNYVWTAFGVSLLALLILYLGSRKRLQKALKNQQQLSAEKTNETG